jgi:DNA-directed RNA polymerase subunit F
MSSDTELSEKSAALAGDITPRARTEIRRILRTIAKP